MKKEESKDDLLVEIGLTTLTVSITTVIVMMIMSVILRDSVYVCIPKEDIHKVRVFDDKPSEEEEVEGTVIYVKVE